MWQIIINGPGYFDTAYELPEGVTHLGRADENDIVLGGDLVSRRHARLVAEGDTLRIEDLGSRNGSRVNGTPLQGSIALLPGDTISLGENTLSVRQPNQVENAATEMVDLGAGGVRRFGHGDDVGASVILAKNIKNVDLLRALDNFSSPFDSVPATAAPILPAAPTAPRGAYETLLLLFHTAEALATSATLTDFLEATMDRVLERIDATTAVVLLRHPTGVFVPAAVRHRGKLAKGEVPVSDGIIEQALSEGRALVVGDVRDDRRFASRESVILYGVDRVLCIPIGLESPFSGVLYVNTSAKNDTELEIMLDTCTAVAHLVATGVQKFSAASGSGAPPLRHHLERFLGPEVAERRTAEVQRTGGRLPALAECNLTIVHAELVGFGALASKLGALRTTELLNDFHSRLGGLVFSFEGTLETFFGESLRALFGTPASKPDDAVRAVRAALALREDWERHMARRPAEERCELRIGINTARVLAGFVGPDSRPSFSAVGDGVSVASWLAATASPGQVLITGKTLAVIGARFDVVPLGERLIRSPRDKVAAFEVVDEDIPQLTNPGVR
ncbi:adenylate/guanylate cyclase domain-containing protein [Archangium violaceum]|uniref:Cyclase n=1 Tax=Archangium violaceum Cb vi76 TaxID=1406225 RepID=A0A084SFH2_9BACT|nr:adenylate/guanylate cyclase domain-containing protein [Archangium violaceum]KFA87207.1 cyclase [Archangium violaceum Cb vi76]